MIPIEIDFTREITASSAPTIESDKKAFSFFFSLLEGRREKDVAIGERNKIFAPYLKPFFPSIGFSAFSFEERKNSYTPEKTSPASVPPQEKRFVSIS